MWLKKDVIENPIMNMNKTLIAGVAAGALALSIMNAGAGLAQYDVNDASIGSDNGALAAMAVTSVAGLSGGYRDTGEFYSTGSSSGADEMALVGTFHHGDPNGPGMSVPTVPIPEASTVVAGILMLLPLGIGVVRSFRKDRAGRCV